MDYSSFHDYIVRVFIIRHSTQIRIDVVKLMRFLDC
jgi:hypothetical protein